MQSRAVMARVGRIHETPASRKCHHGQVEVVQYRTLPVRPPQTENKAGNQIFVRFGTHSYPALIFRPYCMGDWRLLNKITVPLFIQETMIRPI